MEHLQHQKYLISWYLQEWVHDKNLEPELFGSYKNAYIFMRDNWVSIQPELTKQFKWNSYEIAELWKDNYNATFFLHKDYYIKKLNEWYAGEKFKNITDTTVKINKMQKFLDKVNVKKTKDIWHITDAINQFNTQQEKIKKIWRLWICSPFPCLDKITQWIISWKVYTIWWFSNLWKSKLSYHYASHFISKWHKVLYFSLEVEKWLVLANIMASFYELDYSDVINNITPDKDDFENLKIYQNIFNLREIVSIIKEQKADIVFIDFIQNVKADWNSEYERLTNAAQDIQKAAIESWSTIFSLSQVNNESRFKWWSNVMLKWSWSIFASSDVILVLYKDSELKLTIAKNKFWEAWVNFLVNVDYKKNIFKLSKETI